MTTASGLQDCGTKTSGLQFLGQCIDTKTSGLQDLATKTSGLKGSALILKLVVYMTAHHHKN